MKILSIETSCDDTAAAIVKWDGKQVTILANTISSQTSIHNKWGGVVPNLASREHIRNIVPVIEETLARADVKPQDIDLIAVTQGPGLMPALLIGVSTAKTLALVWKKLLIGINHLEGHIYANFIGKISPPTSKGGQEGGSLSADWRKPLAGNTFPLIALIVSGGHTQLVLMRKHFDYTILGETQDDAAGEAFDKVAKMLGLPYPGGPEIAKRADEFRIQRPIVIPAKAGIQDPQNSLEPEYGVNFPRPMLNSNDFNFSFSGLKTAVLYFLKKHTAEMSAQGTAPAVGQGSAAGGKEKFIGEVCYEFQEAVVDVLVHKTEKAILKYSPKTLVIAGGVSANISLRARLQKKVANLNLGVGLPSNNRLTFLTPEFSYSLDNAAMIGAAAAFRFENMNEKQKQSLHKTCLTLDPDANLPLSSI